MDLIKELNVYYLFSVNDQLFTDLTKILIKNAKFNRFYGLAYTKTPCLLEDIYSNVSYCADLFKENVEIDLNFLKSIEDKYDILIADLIHMDRHLKRISKDKRLMAAQILLMNFISDLENFKISLVIVEGVDDFISYFAAIYCKKHQIAFIQPSYIGYESRGCLTSNVFCEPNNFEQEYKQVKKLLADGKIDHQKVEQEIDEYIEKEKQPWYVASDYVKYKIFKFNDLSEWFNSILKYAKDKEGYHLQSIPITLPFDKVLKSFRKSHYKLFLSTPEHQSYLIYPLQFELESSTLVQGKWLNHQRNIIELISKNLPVDTVLYVKEHPLSLGRRNIQFYQEIYAHHNVYLIDHQLNNFQLIAQSKGVITISSSMAIEALMLKKPVLSFGERFYNVSDNVYEVRDLKNLKEYMNNLLSHETKWDDTIALFYTLFKTTTDLGKLSHREYAHADVEALAEEICQQYFSSSST